MNILGHGQRHDRDQRDPGEDPKNGHQDVVDGPRHVATGIARLLGHVRDGLDPRVGHHRDRQREDQFAEARRHP